MNIYQIIILKNMLHILLEKAKAPHSSTLAWKLPWTEEPGGLQSMGLLSQTWQRPHFHFSLSCIGEGNGNPLQCSCLENPRVGGALWAAIYGVAQSQTRLTRLSSSSSSKESTCQCKRHSLDPWVGRNPWRRKWQPLQCSCLRNPMDRGAWQAVVPGAAELDTT